MKKLLILISLVAVLSLMFACTPSNTDTSKDTVYDTSNNDTSTDGLLDSSTDTSIDTSGDISTDTDTNIGILDHTHSYSEWEIIAQPTCTVAGIKTRICKCGHSEVDSVEPTGHTYKETVVPPSSTDKGYTEYKCDCGDTYRDNYTDTVSSSGFLYSVNGDGATCTIMSIGSCYDSNVIIPSTIDGYTVTKLNGGSFSFASYVTSVIVPDTVTEIGSKAFYYCKGLQSVTLGKGVTAIGNSAFEDCTGLVEIINHSDLQLEIGGEEYGQIAKNAIEIHDGESKLLAPVNDFCFYSFNGSNYLVSYSGFDKQLILPESFNGEEYKIHRNIFANSDLISITIPEKVTEIGKDAFSGCNSLVEVINKSSLLITVGSEEHGCVAQNAVVVHNGESKLSEIDDYIFCTLEDACYLVLYNGSEKELTLPESCNGKKYDIYNNAFNLKTQLTKVVIPNGVTKIGARAFDFCMSLTEVVLPDTLIEIGDSAFASTALSSISLPNTLKAIGTSAFYSTSITSINIPDSVTELGLNAFYGCKSLKSVKLGKGITKINLAFNGCYDIEEIEINGDVTELGVYEFSGCKKLKAIKLPSALTKIGTYAFMDCESLTSIELPDGVTFIGSYAFSACKSLKTVSFGKSLETVDRAAFKDCVALEEVILPATAKYIYNDAFYGCANLKTVLINEKIVDISSNAFTNCDNAKIYYYGSKDAFEQEDFLYLTMNHSVYFYSEQQPTETGSYWHYEGNKIAIWE